MAIDVEAYLRSKGIPIKRHLGDEVNVPCFFCGEDPAKRGRLYINVGQDAGLFMCHLCDERGNLRKLLAHFGDSLDDADEDRTSEVLRAAADFYHANLHPKVREWLKDARGLTDETIDKHRFGWAPSEEPKALVHELVKKGFTPQQMLDSGLVVERSGKLYDFFSAVVTLVYHVNGAPVQIRGKELDGKYKTPPGQKARLFNTDAIKGSSEVLIAEGEFDAIVLEQLGFPAVGVPGANSWQDPWTGLLDDAHTVYTVFDNDSAGEKGEAKLTEKVGPKVKHLRLPPTPAAHVTDGPWDVSDWVVKGSADKAFFERLINETRRTTSILISVDQALEEWTALQGVEGLKFGIEQLDLAIRPGLLPGQVMVTLAKTGSGKTISLLNMFQRMKMAQPDMRILFLSLEQTRGDWFERARRIWNFYNLGADPNLVNEGTVNYWRDHLFMVDKNRVSEEELIQAIDDFEILSGGKPDLVAIDYLGYWASTAKGKDRYEKTSNAVMSIKAVAKEKLVPIYTPHQVNRTAEFGTDFEIDQARDAGAVEETGDFVMGLWSPDSMKGVGAEERTGAVHLKIGKSRHGGKGTEIRLQFAPLTLAMVPKEEATLTRLAADELEYAMRRETWRHAIFRHAAGLKNQPVHHIDEMVKALGEP